MPDVMHRVTLEIRRSVDTNRAPVQVWVHILDPATFFAAVRNVPEQYWELDGDNLIEMDQTKKDNVDAQLAADRAAAKAEQDANNVPILRADIDAELVTIKGRLDVLESQ